MNRIFLVALLSLSLLHPLKAQEPGEDEIPPMGLLMDEEAYAAIPHKATLLTRDYTTLPARWSIKQYAPTPKSQGQHGTCTSWATTYAARTIIEDVNNGWTETAKKNAEAFAPIFIYQQIENSGEAGCHKGTYIHEALNTLMSKGAPKFADFSELCAETLPAHLFTKALPYRIDGYFNTFNSNASDNMKVNAVKKAISQNSPVVICMQVPASFCKNWYKNGEVVWEKTETVKDGGWHAMCVVGYDDNKYGGAFEIMNSWGEKWGSGGFIWVKYKDFADYVTFAYEPYLKKKLPPTPEPKNVYSGSARFQLSTGENMKPRLTGTGKTRRYEMDRGYVSGTRYRIYLSNNEPAWVYVIGSDATGEVSTVFPPDDRTSPALLYSSNNIALPDEKWYIEMDDTKGTDNICLLYSADELPIKQIVKSIEAGKGTFAERVNSALGSRLSTNEKLTFGSDAISFKGRSDSSVIPVFIDIKHN